MVKSGRDCGHVVGHQHRLVGIVKSADAQLTIGICPHGPEAAVVLKDEAVIAAADNRRDIAGYDRLRIIGAVGRSIGRIGAVTQLTISV